MCTFVMGNIYIAPNGASVGCVGASVRIVQEIMKEGGGEKSQP
jgi:hypothetical protein